MSDAPKRHPRPKVIAADLSQQQANNSYVPIMQYEDTRVACADCGRSILWTAEQQRYWYEDVKASMYAQFTLRCATCRGRGRHDKHKQAQRRKARQRQSGSD